MNHHYCKCGCGEKVKTKSKKYIFRGKEVKVKTTNKYIEGHRSKKCKAKLLLVLWHHQEYKKVKKNEKVKRPKKIKYCFCGCEQETTGSSYIKGHKKRATRKNLIKKLKNTYCKCGCKEKVKIEKRADGQITFKQYNKGHHRNLEQAKKIGIKIAQTRKERYGWKIRGVDIYSYCPECTSPIYTYNKYCSKECATVGSIKATKLHYKNNPNKKQEQNKKQKKYYANLSNEKKEKQKIKCIEGGKIGASKMERILATCENCKKKYSTIKNSPDRKHFTCSRKCSEIISKELKKQYMPLCACGCGKKIIFYSRPYITGHQPLTDCKCGCGGKTERMSRYDNRNYIAKHQPYTKCACGCGKETKLTKYGNKKYYKSHSGARKKYWENRWKKEGKDTPEIRKAKKRCKCGCGKLWNSLSEENKKKHISKINSINSVEAWKDPIYAAKCSNTFFQGINKPETYLLKLLNKIQPNTFKYCGDGTKWINRKNPDFIRTDGKKKQVVEMFGTYWHSEEKIGVNRETHEEQRKTYFEDVGYDCLILWEHELKSIQTIKRLRKFI